MNLVNNLLRVQFRTLNYSDRLVQLKEDRIVVCDARAYPRFYWIKGQGVLGSGLGKWDYGLLEEFANCLGTPVAILRFTQQYGPLNARLRTGEHRRTTFTIAKWQQRQNDYRHIWEQLRPKGHRACIPHADLKVLPGERFSWWSSELSYQTADLYRLLLLELYSIPRHRLKEVPPFRLQDTLFHCQTLVAALLHCLQKGSSAGEQKEVLAKPQTTMAHRRFTRRFTLNLEPRCGIEAVRSAPSFAALIC